MASNNDTDVVLLDSHNLYGYKPSKAATIIFFLLFSVSTLGHIFQAIRYRTWFMFFTAVLCGGLEMAGWASRAWSSFSLASSMPYKIQASTTVLAPTPLLAANFIIFGRIVRALGQRYSRLKVRHCTLTFRQHCADVVSLMVQGAGGGIAASANTSENANMGSKIILGGIIFQLIIIVVFSACAVDYFIRYKEEAYISSEAAFQMMNQVDRDIPARAAPGKFTTKLKAMTAAVAFTTLCLFIRAVYRVIELAGGWDERIMTTEIYFTVLDGMMIILTIYTTNFIHPGVYLPYPLSISTPSLS
ncbi:RTA1 like protein [Pholiota conissans]|uniref:RTA1 like protein n=1 Tax=Pholiota conissans TaxID=109636 RepID=A0A9P6CP08_9AGAR|nr:RTA1 like protein [Pholiota conissans]